MLNRAMSEQVLKQLTERCELELWKISWLLW